MSPQVCTTALAVPSQTWPFPCTAPKYEPEMVTCVPGTPLAGVMPEMVAVLTVKGTELDQNPICRTRAVPDEEPDATVATICPSLQLTTVARVVPSQAVPVPCVDPKPEPEIVTCVPAVALAGETLVTVIPTTATEYACVAVLELESVNCTVKLLVPAVVGVPEITPTWGSSDRPLG